MLLKKLSLSGFRNNGDAEIGFCDGTNIIFGENGAGKTNVIEAIFFFAAGKSFRGCKEREMIEFGRNEATAKIDFVNTRGEQSLALRLAKREKKKIYRNGVEVSRLSEYFGQFRAVVFSPDHLSLVKGAPEQRRKFLDIAISQSYPRYVAVLSEYNRILMQKNALLRSEIDHNTDLLSVYNERLAASGAVISAKRRAFLDRLAATATEMYSLISEGRETLTVAYETQATSEKSDVQEMQNAYLSLFESKMQQETARQISLYGAHKDDFSIMISGNDARSFASQGQQRSAVLALKLAEGEMSRELTGEYPVFLLDDIMSELDEKRRGYIAGKLSGKQVIITGCEEGLSNFTSGAVFRADKGRITRI